MPVLTLVLFVTFACGVRVDDGNGVVHLAVSV